MVAFTRSYSFYLTAGTAGDTLPILKEPLQNGDGSAIDLTSATVQIFYRAIDNSQDEVQANATIVGSPTLGVVQYQFPALLAGEYAYRWVITFPGANPMTVPNGATPRYILVSNRP